MKKPLILLALVWLIAPLAHAKPTAESSSSRIVGGTPAETNEFPSQVSLQRFDRHFCGGTLVKADWVLTAAHCMSGLSPSDFKVKIGLNNLGETSNVETFSVRKIVVHPEYNQLDYDYALVQLSGNSTRTPMKLNSEKIDICDDEDKAPMSTTVGWGTTSENGSLSKKLLKVAVPLVSAKNCEAAYPNDITKHMICAGYKSGGKDACQGDSGGPLFINTPSGERVIAGIVSWGEGCARPNKFGVYSDVNAELSWIANQLGAN